MNSLMHPVGQARFAEYNPDDVKEALDSSISLAKSRLESIKQIDPADYTYDNIVIALGECADELAQVAAITSHMETVLGDKWREADKLATEIATQFWTELSLDQDIYKLLVDFKAKVGELPANKTRLLDDWITGYELKGVNLPLDKRERLKQISQELSMLEAKFGQNNTDANDKAGILVDDVADLDGLDEHTIAEAKEHATAKKLQGYWLGYSEPLVNEVLVHANNKSLRSRYSAMVGSRGASENSGLIKQILALRYETAALVGCANYSDYLLTERMAKNGKTALSFVQDIRSKYTPYLAGEIKQVEDFARKLESDPNLELEHYEKVSGLDTYYSAKLKQELFGVSDEDTKPYFELHNVIDGMFTVLGKLYGVEFSVDVDAQKWHNDVICYKINDEQDNHIASVWCDWQTRPGKRAGAWMNGFYLGDRRDGKLDEPHLGYVVCNLPKATASRPSLLTIRDVETIWHEFGHFMHYAFSNSELSEQSMMNCKWDFIEAPSQIMENFVWETEVLAIIGKHYQTGEQIPAELINRLIKSRRFRVATKCLRQVVFAEQDLVLHQFTELPDGFDPVEFDQKFKQQVFGHKDKPVDNTILTMLHIFAGGYQSAYYSYKWAEVIEADLYSRFKADGPLNPKTGRDYRDKVLARGDEADPDVLIRDFLGRDFSEDALLARDGID